MCTAIRPNHPKQYSTKKIDTISLIWPLKSPSIEFSTKQNWKIYKTSKHKFVRFCHFKTIATITKWKRKKKLMYFFFFLNQHLFFCFSFYNKREVKSFKITNDKNQCECLWTSQEADLWFVRICVLRKAQIKKPACVWARRLLSVWWKSDKKGGGGVWNGTVVSASGRSWAIQ